MKILNIFLWYENVFLTSMLFLYSYIYESLQGCKCIHYVLDKQLYFGKHLRLYAHDKYPKSALIPLILGHSNLSSGVSYSKYLDKCVTAWAANVSQKIYDIVQGTEKLLIDFLRKECRCFFRKSLSFRSSASCFLNWIWLFFLFWKSCPTLVQHISRDTMHS